MIINQQLLNERLHYDEDSGVLYWKEALEKHYEDSLKRTAKTKANHFNKIHAGKQALNSMTAFGHLKGQMYDQDLLAHRVIWMMKTGEWPKVINHKNQTPYDNRFDNLQNTNFEGNQRNRLKNKNNTSGHTGVRFNDAAQKWYSSIKYKGKFVFFGSFYSKEEAILAFEEGKKQLGFFENHGK